MDREEFIQKLIFNGFVYDNGILTKKEKGFKAVIILGPGAMQIKIYKKRLLCLMFETVEFDKFVREVEAHIILLNPPEPDMVLLALNEGFTKCPNKIWMTDQTNQYFINLSFNDISFGSKKFQLNESNLKKIHVINDLHSSLEKK